MRPLKSPALLKFTTPPLFPKFIPPVNEFPLKLIVPASSKSIRQSKANDPLTIFLVVKMLLVSMFIASANNSPTIVACAVSFKSNWLTLTPCFAYNFESFSKISPFI